MNRFVMESLYAHFLNHRKITTDSRIISPGCIFVALKGDSFDGNQFAVKALKDGASLAIVDDINLKDISGCYFVENALLCLQELANYHRKQLVIPFIGITGTNGKTTTKELTKVVLESRFKIHATQGNLNNHIGVPLTILEIPEDAEIVIIEMGANHPGEIDFLCKIALPDYGLITNVGKAHLEGFGSLAGVFQTKTELYRHVLASKGKVFVNSQYNELMVQAGETPLTYSRNSKDAQLTGELISVDPTLSFRCHSSQEEVEVLTQLAGGYNLENALAAIRIGMEFGISLSEAKKAIESYIPVNKRSQWISTATNRVLLDAYNANPSSMSAALENFASLTATHKVLILGDMLELGADSSSEHQLILAKVITFGFQEVYFVGKEFGKLELPVQFKHFDSSDALHEYLSSQQIQGKHIFIKGSRGMKLEKVIPSL